MTNAELIEVMKEEGVHEAFEYEGYSCVINRNFFGAWCGYVGVAEDHPLHGIDQHSGRVVLKKDWLANGELSRHKIGIFNAFFGDMHQQAGNDWEDRAVGMVLAAHHGITYSGNQMWEAESTGPGVLDLRGGHITNEKNLWWLGFDCGHHSDLVPYNLLVIGLEFERMGIYKTKDYVITQVKLLAEQLDKIKEYVIKSYNKPEEELENHANE